MSDEVEAAEDVTQASDGGRLRSVDVVKRELEYWSGVADASRQQRTGGNYRPPEIWETKAEAKRDALRWVLCIFDGDIRAVRRRWLVVFDVVQRRPACVLLQAALGGDTAAVSAYPSESWLTTPTADMRMFRLTDREHDAVAETLRRRFPGRGARA